MLASTTTTKYQSTVHGHLVVYTVDLSVSQMQYFLFIYIQQENDVIQGPGRTSRQRRPSTVPDLSDDREDY